MRLDDLDRRNGSLSQTARPSNIGEKEWERWRARVERKKQSKNEKETVKILGIWGFLFVLIIDCFVVNFLDQICSLFLWKVILFRPKKENLCYQCLTGYNINFIFWSKRCVGFFFIHPKPKFVFPYNLFFSKILGPPFHLGVLGNCLIGLIEGSVLFQN